MASLPWDVVVLPERSDRRLSRVIDKLHGDASPGQAESSGLFAVNVHLIHRRWFWLYGSCDARKRRVSRCLGFCVVEPQRAHGGQQSAAAGVDDDA
jgi:hypothetical protein